MSQTPEREIQRRLRQLREAGSLEEKIRIVREISIETRRLTGNPERNGRTRQ